MSHSRSHSRSGLPDRIRSSVRHWFQDRLQESIHCAGCDSVIFPFVSYCPKCGQANPTTVSVSVAVYLVIAFVFLAIILSFLTIVF
jgi:uncharacterized OB-fold protein